MLSEILSKLEAYVDARLNGSELRSFAGGIVASGDRRADQLAADIFSRFVLAEEGVISDEQRDSELRGLLAGARAMV